MILYFLSPQVSDVAPDLPSDCSSLLFEALSANEWRVFTSVVTAHQIITGHVLYEIEVNSLLIGLVHAYARRYSDDRLSPANTLQWIIGVYAPAMHAIRILERILDLSQPEVCIPSWLSPKTTLRLADYVTQGSSNEDHVGSAYIYAAPPVFLAEALLETTLWYEPLTLPLT